MITRSCQHRRGNTSRPIYRAVYMCMGRIVAISAKLRSSTKSSYPRQCRFYGCTAHAVSADDSARVLKYERMNCHMVEVLSFAAPVMMSLISYVTRCMVVYVMLTSVAYFSTA